MKVAGAGRNDDRVAGFQLVRDAVPDRRGVAAGAVQQPHVLVGRRPPLRVDQIRAGHERRRSGNDVIDLAHVIVLGHRVRLRLVELGAMHHADRDAALADIHRSHLLIDLVPRDRALEIRLQLVVRDIGGRAALAGGGRHVLRVHRGHRHHEGAGNQQGLQHLGDPFAPQSTSSVAIGVCR